MYEYRAKIVRIVDGDTVHVDIDLGFGVWLRDQSLRLTGIDAPEIRGEQRDQGLLSKDAIIEKLSGAVVTIQTEKDTRGKYGRWLAVIICDGCNINEWLIEHGYAQPYF